MVTRGEKAGEHKRGALSTEDMAFIRKNVNVMDPAAMAAAINRNVTPVIRYIQRNRIGQTYEEIKGQEEKSEQQIYKSLKGKTFYKNLKDQLTVPELDYFADHWVALVLQFNGDLAPSEEMELKELLILEILKNREAAAEYNRMMLIEELSAQIKEETKKPIKERDRELLTELRRQRTDVEVASASYIKNFQTLCDRADKMRKALHASRQDRVKHLENAKVDFVSFLKLLEEHGEKLRVGREMEIIRKAKEKEQRRLSNLHAFSDGKVDRPILNEETVFESEDPT